MTKANKKKSESKPKVEKKKRKLKAIPTKPESNVQEFPVPDEDAEQLHMLSQQVASKFSILGRMRADYKIQEDAIVKDIDEKRIQALTIESATKNRLKIPQNAVYSVAKKAFVVNK